MVEAGEVVVTMFGGFELTDRGQVQHGIAKRSADRLLAFLLLQNGRGVSTGSLAATFYRSTDSVDSLRHGLTEARRVLGTEGWRISTERGFVRINPEGLDVDVLTFDIMARKQDTESLNLARSLYRGPLLRGWNDDWVARERDSRRSGYLNVLRTLADRYEESGNLHDASELLRAVLVTSATNEADWIRLMGIYDRLGERIKALDLYRRATDHFRKAADIEPPTEMQAVYRNIRSSSLRSKEPVRHILPSVLPETPGGAVPLGSRYYIERPGDNILQSSIAACASIVVIKGPRQVGKSSLLARGVDRAAQVGRALYTDLETFEENEINSLDALCRSLGRDLAHQVEFEHTPRWNESLGPGVNLERFLIGQVVEPIDEPVVWAIDEVDRLFTRPPSSSFFALLRSWHERRAFEPSRPWARFTLLLACATEAHLYIEDLNQSPFNVGARVKLEDFTTDQVSQLDKLHGSPLKSDEELHEFRALFGGHPFLIRRGLYELTVGNKSLIELRASAADHEGPFGEHIRRILRLLDEQDALQQAIRSVLAAGACGEREFYRLRSAGLIAGESSESAQPRCGLYKQVFLHYLQ